MTTTLRLVTGQYSGYRQSLDRQQASFEEQLDGNVRIEREHRPLPEIQHELIQNNGFKEDTYDLFLCLSDWLPAVADAGLIAPIDDHLAEDPPQDWPDGWAESMRELMNWKGSTYGISYHDGPQMFHYRQDLFESIAEQQRFRAEHGRPLHVPKTWDEFVDVARFFTRPGKNLWGTVVAAKPDGHNDVYDWLIQLWSRGGQVFDEAGNVVFDAEAGKEALRFYHDLIHEHEVVPADCVDFASPDSGRFYADGNAAMMWNWAGFGVMSEDPDASVFGNTGYGVIPRSNDPAGQHTSLTVLYGFTIPDSSDNKDLAYQFIKHCASPEQDRITTLEGASGTRFSTWRDPDVLQRNTFYSIVEEMNTSNVNYLPRIPQFTTLNEILNEMVKSAVVDRTKTPEVAVEWAAAETREQIT